MKWYLAGSFIFVLALELAAHAGESNRSVLEKVWSVGRAQACTQSMRAAFTDEQLARLSVGLGVSADRKELAAVLNPFLRGLGMSHTELFVAGTEDYAFFKNLPWVSPGIQMGQDSQGYFVREVLDGFSAQDVGLQRGDRLLELEGQAFSGTWGEWPGVARLAFSRPGLWQRLWVQLSAPRWGDAFQQALRQSVRRIGPQGDLGYVRLWSGAHPQSAGLLQQLVHGLAPQFRGLILDLRGGYGGAWWEHLDPFFADRATYFAAQETDAHGNTSERFAPAQSNPNAYLGPLAVLINEGVRSGKEAMAYQFKKTGRARLIGTPTPGYFSAGSLFFADQADYLLYLCTRRVTLDGVEIEGVGIPPDEHVPVSPYVRDAALDAAIRYLSTF